MKVGCRAVTKGKLTLKIWVRRKKLSSLVVGLPPAGVADFLPETLMSGTGLYIRPRAEEILSCDLQALTSHAVSPFWVVVPKISRLWARPLAPIRASGPFSSMIVSPQPGPGPGLQV
jgi:hypothetical protein